MADDPPDKKLGTHNVGRGKTGVEIPYYKPHEFKKLSKDQIDKLLEHRQNTKDKIRDKKTGNKKKRMRASIISVLKSALKGNTDANLDL